MVRPSCVYRLISRHSVLSVRCMAQLAQARPAVQQDVASYMRWVHRCNNGILHTLVPWQTAGRKHGDANAAAPDVLGYLHPEYALRFSSLGLSFTASWISENFPAKQCQSMHSVASSRYWN